MSEAGEPNQARTGKGRERQARVLAAALEVYAEGGYGAPIAAVAKRAGLTLPGLLHYYPTKDDLLLALLESHDAESDALMAPESTDWRQALRQLGAINRQNLAKPEVVRLFSILNAESLTRDHPAADWFRRRTDRARGNFAAILRAGIAAGGSAPAPIPTVWRWKSSRSGTGCRCCGCAARPRSTSARSSKTISTGWSRASRPRPPERGRGPTVGQTG